MMERTYPLYIVNVKKKTYEKIECSSEEQREIMEYAIGAVSCAFDEEVGDHICIKYVQPEFVEDEVCE